MTKTVAEKMAARTQKTPICWPWIGNINQDTGYGRLSHGGRNYVAHRVAYEMAKGPIPDGLVVDHTCHNGTDCPGGSSCLHRRCVNPDHLDVTTIRENTLRGAGIPAALARATHCKNGHLYDEANTIIQRGNRLCRTCRDARAAYWNAQRRTPKDPTRCRNGHERTEANTYVFHQKAGRPYRSCRVCHANNERARRQRRAAA